jgi:hypothetical protein
VQLKPQDRDLCKIDPSLKREKIEVLFLRRVRGIAILSN